MAGIGEKPATRSGPYSLIVYAFAAAISSAASSQPTLTKPPRPRFDTQSRRFSGSCTMDRQAATGAIVSRALRQRRMSLAPTSGYVLRVPEERYQLSVEPRGQQSRPRLGRTGWGPGTEIRRRYPFYIRPY